MSQISRWKDAVEVYNVPHLRLRQIARLVDECRPETVLDLGCAKGTLATLLRPDIMYSGADFIEPDTPYPFVFYPCNFNEGGITPSIGSYDVVVCSGLLEYISDLPGFLQQIHDHVSANGFFICSYFNMKHIRRKIQSLSGGTPYRHPDWKNNYSCKALCDLIQQQGFHLEKIHPMSEGWKDSAPVSDTVNEKDLLLPYRRSSGWLAHQILMVFSKK